MNLGLFNKRYLAAGEYTIGDMICYPWAVTWQSRGIDFADFPNVKRWLDEIGERPAVKKAMAMGAEFREDPATAGQANMFVFYSPSIQSVSCRCVVA